MTLIEKVKANLILEHDKDDELLEMYIDAAISYAERDRKSTRLNSSH